MANTPGPLVPLTKFWRGVIGSLLVALATAHIVWPDLGLDAVSLGLVVAAVIVVFFDIESFEWQGIKASRVKREIREAEQVVQQVEPPPEPAPLPQPPEPGTFQEIVIGYADTVHRKPLDLLPPRDRFERLLWAAEQIRLELIVLAGNAGHLPERVSWDRYSAAALSAVLAERGAVPTSLGDPINTIVELRNAAVHEGRRVAADVIFSAADLALNVLVKLRSVKRNYTRIRVADVRLYRDQSLSTFHDTGGVMLVQLDEAGKTLHVAVYPRVQTYVAGRFVSWEWNLERTFHEEAWYHDPESNTARPAFSASATFIGREYPQQWGLEYRLPRTTAGLAE